MVFKHVNPTFVHLISNSETYQNLQVYVVHVLMVYHKPNYRWIILIITCDCVYCVCYHLLQDIAIQASFEWTEQDVRSGLQRIDVKKDL